MSVPRPLSVGARVLSGALLVTMVTGPAATATPDTDYEMPFRCGEDWTGTTRSSHSPSVNAVDWNRSDDFGDPVVAAAAGTVTTADTVNDSGYGRWVVIDHGGGESTLYAHMDTVKVSVGDRVQQGDQIGTVGDTGNTTGPHLHFEEREGSTVVEPYFHGIKFVFGSTLASQNCPAETLVDVPLAANMVDGPRAELITYRRTDPAQFNVRRPGQSPQVIKFGRSTDMPIVGDWDGDGHANVGVRTPLTRTFKLQTPAGTEKVVFGRAGDLPVAGDWDGDGTTDLGVRRDDRFILRAADGTRTRIDFGRKRDLPITGDWNGDGLTDVGIYRPGEASFRLRIVDDSGTPWRARIVYGDPDLLPVTGDWDGNGTTDLGVWDPDTATFSLRRATAPTATARRSDAIQFGAAR